MEKMIFLLLISFVFLLIDLYAFRAFNLGIGRNRWTLRFGKTLYWSFAVVVLLIFWTMNTLPKSYMPPTVSSPLTGLIVTSFLAKLILLFFAIMDDLVGFFRWVAGHIRNLRRRTGNLEPPTDANVGDKMSRSQFLARAGLFAAAIPAVGIPYGMVVGAHDYRIIRQRLVLPHLPKAFHGIRFAQISDIHSGSFFNKTAVKGGVEMLLNEQPDIIFFTGDLVNHVAEEVKDYVPIFEKLRAPLGTYSIMGNHDYGDYVRWPNAAAKRRNLEKLRAAHREMGWQLLSNENKILTQGGESLAILGVENWSNVSRFPKYGDLDRALKGAENAAVKLLLSHDPTHWEGQVLPQHPAIDLMLAGHTHGMQAGIQVAGMEWSPVQYLYKHWAGLYEEKGQYLYVNRGYGYNNFLPSRVGMPPEITIFELVCS